MFRELINNNSLQDWGYALLTALAFIAILHLLRRVVLRHLMQMAKNTDTAIDDFLVEVLSATRILLATTLGLYAGTHFLNLPTTLDSSINRIFVVVLFIQVGFWCSRGLMFWLNHYFSQGDKEDEGSRHMSLSLLSLLGRTLVWILVLLLILDNLGVNVTTLIASLGIGGIAIALAVQNILGDLFASLSIAIDKPFVIGDFIVLGEEMGTVEHVGLKTTRIRSLSGEQLVLANNDLLKSRIHNYKRMQERRVVLALGVTYDTPADQLENIPKLIKQAVTAQSNARFDRSHFNGLGAFSLDFETVYYVLQPDYGVYMDVQQAINLQLVRSFAKEGIEFAFPTQTLHLDHGASPAMTKTVGPAGAAASR